MSGTDRTERKKKKSSVSKPIQAEKPSYIQLPDDETLTLLPSRPLKDLPEKVRSRIKHDGIKIDELKGKEIDYLWHIATMLEDLEELGCDVALYDRNHHSRAHITSQSMEKAEKSIHNLNDKVPIKKIFPKLEGGFGEVFTGKMKMNGKKCKVAVKKVPHTPDRKKANLSELFFLLELRHPNIVNLEGCYFAQTKGKVDQLFFAMEFLEGGTLQEAAKSGLKLPDANIAYIARESFRGIAHMHSLNYAHRDLKPANIMLSTKGEVKIIDFGLACDMGMGRRIKMLGSPMWVPPEMIQFRPHGLLVDIWSMGVCLLEFYLDDVPLKKTPFLCMLTIATQGLAHFIPDTAEADAKDVLSKCLIMDPDKRATAEAILEHKWFKRSEEELTNGVVSILCSIFMKQLGVF